MTVIEGAVIAQAPDLVITALVQFADRAEAFGRELARMGWAAAPDFQRRADLARRMAEEISVALDGGHR